jgi:hypothetical protein
LLKGEKSQGTQAFQKVNPTFRYPLKTFFSTKENFLSLKSP